MKHRMLAKIGLLILMTAFLSSAKTNGQQKQSLLQLGKSPIKDVIAAMTLEEKASLVIGGGIPGDHPRNPYKPIPGTLSATTKTYVAGSVGRTVEIPRLGITSIVMSDGPAGLNLSSSRPGDNKIYHTTAYPAATSLASTWDKELVFKIGKSMGNEALEYGIDIVLTPGLNIQRNPLGGRNFEYFSEDPLVSGKMAAAIVSGIQSKGVGTSVKHFAANNQETNRVTVDAVVSERALREIYLKAFQIVVNEAQPWTVMGAYNSLNGAQTTENHDLLTTVLRKDWGYKGLVMTDWGAGYNAVAQLKAGSNLIMPGPQKVDSIMQAVKDGQLSEKVLDENVEAVLRLLLLSPRFKHYAFSNNPDLAKNAKVVRAAAADGMVLLKNVGNTLPVQLTNQKLALFGDGSYETLAGGSGSGSVMSAPATVNIIEGLHNSGYKIDEQLRDIYNKYIKENTPEQSEFEVMRGRKKRPAEMKVDASLAAKMADETALAIVTIFRNAGEGTDRAIENDFLLSETERNNLQNISTAFHAKGKKLVVLLNIGGVIETASWNSLPDAILVIWTPGQEAGNAVADIISGKVTPSGKLAITFPVKYEDVPSAKNFPGSPAVNQNQVIYEEGIYVGYRYYNSFGVKPVYPFGYGLSYTRFAYSNLKLSASSFNNKLTATITVTNTGKVPGKEVVQLYLSAPQTKLDKPSEELKGFAKTTLLKPGASQTITFTLDTKDLASFYTQQSAWIADAGNYVVKVGASSEDIKLAKSFRLAKDILVEKVNKALVPQLPINEIKRGADARAGL